MSPFSNGLENLNKHAGHWQILEKNFEEFKKVLKKIRVFMGNLRVLIGYFLEN